MKSTDSLRKPLNQLLKSIYNTVVIALALSYATTAVAAQASEVDRGYIQGPELPDSVCDTLNLLPGNQASAHLYASGVQIYRWNGVKWDFAAPEAPLFADACGKGAVGIHYSGPTWEAEDGSVAVGTRLTACSPAPGAIPWLLLGVTFSSEHGRLSRITYIQRVNTVGGAAPTESGSLVGEEAHVPYTAEYYFYHSVHD